MPTPYDIIKRFVPDADNVVQDVYDHDAYFAQRRQSGTSLRLKTKVQILLARMMSTRYRKQDDLFSLYKDWKQYIKCIIGDDLYTWITTDTNTEHSDVITLKYLLKSFTDYLKVIGVPKYTEDGKFITDKTMYTKEHERFLDTLLHAKPDALQEHVNKLKTELDKADVKADDDLLKDIERLEQNIKTLEGWVDGIKEDMLFLVATSEKYKELEDEMKGALEELSELNAELKQKKEELRERETTIDRLKRRIDKKTRKIEKTQEEIQAEKEAKVTNLGEFFELFEHSNEDLENMVHELFDQHPVLFTNLTNDQRKTMLPMIQAGIKRLMTFTEPGSVIYVKYRYHKGGWRTKKLSPEEFEKWMNRAFVTNDGFILKGDEEEVHMVTTEGDQEIIPRASLFDEMHIIVATGEHAAGGGFAQYYYVGGDKAIAQQLRRYQICDHVPTNEDEDLMVPCTIHTLLLAAKGKLTDKLYMRFKQLVYSRVLTRWVSRASLKRLCCEFEFVIHQYNLNGVKQCTLTTFGDCESEFGTITRRRKTPRFVCQMVIWEDHCFVLEDLDNGFTSAEFVKELLEKGELKPLNKLQCNVYSTKIWNRKNKQHEGYEISDLSYEMNVFKTPEEMYNTTVKRNIGYSDAADKHIPEIKALTIDSVVPYLKRLSDEDKKARIPNIAHYLFLKYLIDNNIKLMAESSYVKHFIRRSIHGGVVALKERFQTHKPVVSIDKTSAYPSALADIDIPVGIPSLVKETDDVDAVLRLPGIFFIECDVEYTKQHELDFTKGGRMVI